MRSGPESLRWWCSARSPQSAEGRLGPTRQVLSVNQGPAFAGFYFSNIFRPLTAAGHAFECSHRYGKPLARRTLRVVKVRACVNAGRAIALTQVSAIQNPYWPRPSQPPTAPLKGSIESDAAPATAHARGVFRRVTSDRVLTSISHKPTFLPECPGRVTP